MKTIEKQHAQPEIDEDTGLPIEVLRAELLKGVNSPTDDRDISIIMEEVKQKGREYLKKPK